MDATGPTIRFVGDLGDPWVMEILGSISDLSEVHAVMCVGDVPDRLFEPDQPPRLLIVHRTRLSQADAARIEQWRSVPRVNALPRVILCFSPYVRYAELERCSRGVDLAISEATAVETLSRHVSCLLERRDEPPRAAPAADCLPVQVISSNHELRAVLSEICLAEGFKVSSGREFTAQWQGRAAGADRAAKQMLTLWDIPVLVADWPRLLEERTKLGPVVALLGFADRATVGQARASGAAGCLDLPLDVNDLVHVIERVNRKLRSDSSTRFEGRIEPAHAVPPGPVSRAKRGRAAIRQRETRPPLWPEDEAASTINYEKPA
jgi:CheY-like chemotaxis protein